MIIKVHPIPVPLPIFNNAWLYGNLALSKSDHLATVYGQSDFF